MNRKPHNHRASGFTLLELLVVISILTILLGLFIGAGVAVTRNARANATRNILLSLDRALEEYMMANGGALPPFDRLAYAGVPGYDGPNGDASPADYFGNTGDNPMPQRPDASVFIRQAKGIGDVDAILAAIPERFLVLTVTPANVAPLPALEGNFVDNSPSVVDSWSDEEWSAHRAAGEPLDAWPIREQSLIYYVHPNNRRPRANTTLAEFPDAQELYGACVNGRPYFMSAGPDGFYGHPDEIDSIVNHYGIQKKAGESDPQFWNRALLQAREDNLYSAPVDINFNIDAAVFPHFNPSPPPGP